MSIVDKLLSLFHAILNSNAQTFARLFEVRVAVSVYLLMPAKIALTGGAHPQTSSGPFSSSSKCESGYEDSCL